MSQLKSSLLWGAISGLSFLVMLQGYELLTDQRVSIIIKFGTAFGLTATTAASAYVTREYSGNESP
jgi:hypothetical protein